MHERSLTSPGFTLSVASGVACAPPDESLQAAVAEADRRMYEAKQRL